MIHLEQERVQDTVGRLEHMRGILSNAPPKTRPSSVCRLGRWSRRRDLGCWWGCRWASAVANALVLCVGAEAPLAQQWHGAQPGDQVAWAPQKLTIQAIH